MPQNRNAESGNVFMFILLGVVMFAALAFTISRGFRSDTTSTMSERQTTLLIQDTLNYAQTISRAIDLLRRKGCSEKEISFYHDNLQIASFFKNLYDNSDSPTDLSCHIFQPEGAGVTFRSQITDIEKISADLSNSLYSVYHFVTRGQIAGVGKLTQNDPSMVIERVSEEFCQSFNKVALGSETIYTGRWANYLAAYNNGTWSFDGGNDSYVRQGSYTNPELFGQRSFCLQSPDDTSLHRIIITIFER